MNLTKRRDGSYIPSYPKDWEYSKKIKVGEELSAYKDRNPEFHRKVMALFQLGFENQDVYDSFDIYRYVTTMKAGFVVFVDGTDKKKHPLPESLSFASMKQERFEQVFKAVKEVIAKEIGITGDQAEAELASFY